jgi:hypothetical protein
MTGTTPAGVGVVGSRIAPGAVRLESPPGCRYAALMKMRLILPVAVVVLGVFGPGLVCNEDAPLVPEFLTIPDTIYQGAPAAFAFVTRTPDGGAVYYAIDWGDGMVDTSKTFASGDTATLRHTWGAAGGFELRARATLANRPEVASDWTEPVSVSVLANGVPAVPGFTVPERTLPDAWAFFSATTTDPDGDSVSVLFDYNGTVGAWTGFVASGGTALDSHRFAAVGTVQVRCRAKDGKGSESAWSEPEALPVEKTGTLSR